MFNLIKEINSRWATETRWLDTKPGGGMKQKSKTEHSTRKLTMAILPKGREGGSDKSILEFRDGPTGYESYYLNEITLEGDEEFCICAGTPNRWPACYVDMPTVRKFVEEYKAALVNS